MEPDGFPSYGVHRRAQADTVVERAAEAICLVGYAVLDGGYDAAMLGRLSDVFDRVFSTVQERYGNGALARIGEQDAVRAPMAFDPAFLDLACNPAVLGVCRVLIADYLVLNQQNGVRNPPAGQVYSQGAYHRDLPYQHFTSSRPLAVSALFCLDDFTVDTGATWVVPGSHKMEEFPSDDAIRSLRVQVTAPAGSFIVMDSMIYHSGGLNQTARPRRGVNHVYGLPILRQQIDLPRLLGADFTSDANMRRLLGYDVQAPDSLAAYYAVRSQRTRKTP